MCNHPKNLGEGGAGGGRVKNLGAPSLTCAHLHSGYSCASNPLCVCVCVCVHTYKNTDIHMLHDVRNDITSSVCARNGRICTHTHTQTHQNERWSGWILEDRLVSVHHVRICRCVCIMYTYHVHTHTMIRTCTCTCTL